MNAVVDDELTRYGETSGDDSDDLYIKIIIYSSIQLRYQKEENVLQHNQIHCSDKGYCGFTGIIVEFRGFRCSVDPRN